MAGDVRVWGGAGLTTTVDTSQHSEESVPDSVEDEHCSQQHQHSIIIITSALIGEILVWIWREVIITYKAWYNFLFLHVCDVDVLMSRVDGS